MGAAPSALQDSNCRWKEEEEEEEEFGQDWAGLAKKGTRPIGSLGRGLSLMKRAPKETSE